jgi:hypothetical protein
MTGMQEVRCHECGESLGWQPDDIEVDRGMWVHNRCPVRLARNLGLNDELYDKALGATTNAICLMYPDFPHAVLDDDNDLFRLFRAGMAAEAVLEALGKVGFKLRTA